jgi:hypothetical protein
MRIVVNVLALLLLVLTTAAQTVPSKDQEETADEQSGICPTTHNLESSPSAKYWLEGVIGSKNVKMFLNRGGSGVVGLFYEPVGDWTPVLLGGMWKSRGIDLTAGTDSDAYHSLTPIGRLQGQLANNVFLGHWTSKGADHSEPVRLSVVPEIGCDGKGEWKTFDSPNWPFSFSYPASWHIKEEKDYIRVMCPDPETMAYSFDVYIAEGVGEPPEESGLVRCGDNWRYGAKCAENVENDPFNPIPKQSVRLGVKILDVSDGHEWRNYCRNGGYIGQGGGTDIFVLSPDGWVEVSGAGDVSDIVAPITRSMRPHTSK